MTFSVVVVVSKGIENKSRQAVFEKCFESLLGQDYPHRQFEIVLVNSGAQLDPHFLDQIEGQAKNQGVSLTIIEPQRGNIGPAKGRNLGWRIVWQGQTKLRSEAIAFTDDDVVVPNDWLCQLASSYEQNPEAAGVGGRALPTAKLVKNNVWAAYEQFVYEGYPQANPISRKVLEHPVFGGHLSYKLKVLVEMRGFDERVPFFASGEEADLKERVLAAGYFLLYTSTTVTHLADYSWSRFQRQQKSRGVGIIYYRLSHGLRVPTRTELWLRIFVSPFLLPVFLFKTKGRTMLSALETLAYLLRQLGKIQSLSEVRFRLSGSRRQKIKILFADHSPLCGGAQLALVRHLKYLDRTKFDPMAVIGQDLSTRSALAQVKDLKTEALVWPRLKTLEPWTVAAFLKCLGKLWQILHREKPDFLVANTERSFYFLWLIAVLARKPLLVFVRDFEFSPVLLRILGGRTRQFLCVSKSIRDHYRLKAEKAPIVYVGSDLRERLLQVSPEQERKARVTLELEVGEEKLIVGFVGRLEAWKGPQLLLASLALLPPEIKSRITAIFVGDGPFKQEMIARAEKLGLSSLVRWTGFVNQPEIYYRIFDIFVQVSIKPEPFATTVVEAALAKLPIIATQNGGTPEFVIDGETGLLVEPRAERLAAAIEILFTQPELRAKLGEAALQKAQQNFTEEKITRNLEAIYASVVT